MRFTMLEWIMLRIEKCVFLYMRKFLSIDNRVLRLDILGWIVFLWFVYMIYKIFFDD